MCPSDLYANDSDEASQIAFSFENIPYLKLTNQNFCKNAYSGSELHNLIGYQKISQVVHERHQLISLIDSSFSH